MNFSRIFLILIKKILPVNIYFHLTWIVFFLYYWHEFMMRHTNYLTKIQSFFSLSLIFLHQHVYSVERQAHIRSTAIHTMELKRVRDLRKKILFFFKKGNKFSIVNRYLFLSFVFWVFM